MVGLPPIPLTLTIAQHRAVEIWLQAAIDRVEREGRMNSLDAREAVGRVNGAKRVAMWLSETLTPPPPSVESSETGGST